MINIKYDILSKLSTDKYLAEVELHDYINSSAHGYRAKIDKISEILGEIILINSKIDMVDHYFKDVVSNDLEK